MASHVAVLNQGKLEQFGSPSELVGNPATAFVATFVGTPPANLVPAGPDVPGTASLPEGTQAMYRPEDLRVSAEPAANAVPMDFAEASPVAGRVMITGTRRALRLTAVVDVAPALSVGDTAYFCLPPEPAAVFSASGERLP